MQVIHACVTPDNFDFPAGNQANGRPVVRPAYLFETGFLFEPGDSEFFGFRFVRELTPSFSASLMGTKLFTKARGYPDRLSSSRRNSIKAVSLPAATNVPENATFLSFLLTLLTNSGNLSVGITTSEGITEGPEAFKRIE